MKHGKTVEPPVLRYLLGIKIMYKRGQCYLHLYVFVGLFWVYCGTEVFAFVFYLQRAIRKC